MIVEKYSADKIGFFALLAIMLVIAQLIVSVRSSLSASGPINLSNYGLSVQMPEGNGWLAEKDWTYKSNAYHLRGFFNPDKRFPQTLVECSYLLMSDNNLPDDTFRAILESTKGMIAETGEVEIGGLIFHWAYINSQSRYSSVYYAAARLNDNRQFNIEISSASDQKDILEQAFKLIAESLVIEKSQSTEAAKAAILKVTQKSLSVLINEELRKDFFLIKDAALRPVGFDMNVKYGLSVNKNLVIKAATMFYIKGFNEQQVFTTFESNGSLREFSWKSETATRIATSETILSLKNDVLKITSSAYITGEKDYRISSSAIPEIFFAEVLAQLIEDGSQEVLVDFLESDGSIMPVLIKIMETENSQWVAALEHLDSAGYTEQVIMDADGKIQRIEIHQNGNFFFERTNNDEILLEFPEMKDSINRIFQSDKI